MRANVERLGFRLELLVGMIQREVLGRYRGSHFGVLWSLASPLLLLAVFTFAFHELFGARWPGVEGRAGFAMMVFAGMVLHGMLSEVLVKSPLAVSGQPNFVKKLVFPLTVLPLVTVGAALVHACVALIVLVLACLVLGPALHWTGLLLPLVLVPYVVLLCGLAWILAALGVYVRDIAQLGGLVATAMLFLSPVFYPLSAVPPAYAGIVSLNPLTFAVESTRGLLFDGRLPDPSLAGGHVLAAVVVAVVGLLLFRRLRPGFGDVL